MVRRTVPNAFTSRVRRIVSGRRGQIRGFYTCGLDHLQELQGKLADKVLQSRAGEAAA
jgi:hypothetical protein